MSDLSIISHDYSLNAEFARKFNDAVVNLKRVYLLNRIPSEESSDHVEKSRIDLKGLIESLILALQDEGKPWTADQAQVPADVVERLRKQLTSELPETIAELRQISSVLAARSALNEAAFLTLDRVCEAADATASAAFRRLRRI